MLFAETQLKANPLLPHIVGDLDGVPVWQTAGSEISGLDRFVYLRGGSGRRYVFSKVTRGQEGLYRDCVFAVRETGAETARPCANPPLGLHSGDLYVHLLDGQDACAILTDLNNVYETAKPYRT
jgi:hypothetical protein